LHTAQLCRCISKGHTGRIKVCSLEDIVQMSMNHESSKFGHEFATEKIYQGHKFLSHCDDDCVEWQQFHFGYKPSGRSRRSSDSTEFKFMVFESFEASSCSRCVVAFAAPA
jgi:hypothetical protein